jgi:dUTP pyrophosphatase
MRVRVTRIDRALPLPARATEGAVAVDLVTRVDTTIEPHSVGLVPANVVVSVPPGHVLVVALRSSTPRRLGLMCPHGFGVIDRDYCGPEDEIQVQVFNIRSDPVTVSRGDRIGQAFLLPVTPIEWEEVSGAGAVSRGGFGSTGSSATPPSRR